MKDNELLELGFIDTSYVEVPNCKTIDDLKYLIKLFE